MDKVQAESTGRKKKVKQYGRSSVRVTDESFLRLFIRKYGEFQGHISDTCKALKIDRCTYYNWLRISWFKEAIDAVNESFIDDSEVELKNRRFSSDACLIFFLKTKGRARGYDERQTIALEGRTQIVIEGEHRRDGS